MTVPVEHRLGLAPTPVGREYMKTLRSYAAVDVFLEFYENHNGLQFCRAFNSLFDEARPLVELKPAERIREFSDQYHQGGRWAWTIDLNKSKSLYRGSATWLAFAEVDSGPACLTIFLDGDHAGKIIYLAPEPEFNILRPIAKGFNALLGRIARDVAGFLHWSVHMSSFVAQDGQNYALVPLEYRFRSNRRPPSQGRPNQ